MNDDRGSRLKDLFLFAKARFNKNSLVTDTERPRALPQLKLGFCFPSPTLCSHACDVIHSLSKYVTHLL